MTLRGRILFLSAAWLVVLMPFMFWRGPWFGRPLSEQQIANYLQERDPRRVNDALVQIGQRMGRRDPTVMTWYPDLLALAKSPSEQVRATDAWAMGQDPTRPEFRTELSQMLRDRSPAVRAAAALALVRFDDASGHDEIVALLRPMTMHAPAAGQVVEVAKPGSSLRRFATVAKIEAGDDQVEVRAPWECRVVSASITRGQQVTAGAEVATLQPAADTVYEALRALQVIGRLEDLAAIAPYVHRSPDVPERVRQQAERTGRAIRASGDRVIR
ncbi:MAG: HEAT repeat domain-containing protein [Terriglobales bacterium]